MHTPRNPADLLGLGRDPALCRLLRACGTDEACITGGASDYDQFLALAAAMPLCEGHPLREEINATLQEATGLSAPLCPHTAHLHWEAWVELYLYGREVTTTTLPAVCPDCTPPIPTVLQRKDVTLLPDPTAVKAPDLTAWSGGLESALPAGKTPALFTLPEKYVFTRPNPYHANLLVGKVAEGEALTEEERNLLLTQALRVWGLALAGRAPDTVPPLFLLGGTPEAVTALLAYLHASKALPSLTWIPDDPADAATVSGLYACVGTGFRCKGESGESEESGEGAAKDYASVAPVGRAVILSQ